MRDENRKIAISLVEKMCKKHKYEYEIYDYRVYIKTTTDDWEVIFSKFDPKEDIEIKKYKYKLKHLNKHGKMHWHRQGTKFFHIYQIENRITTHVNYCKMRGF